MKKIYILFVLLNVLVMGGATAQSNYPYCNIHYHLDTITYNPAAYNAGTNVPFSGVDTFMSSLVPIGFTFNFYGNNYSQVVVGPSGHLSFNDTMANYHPSYVSFIDAWHLPFAYGNVPKNSIFLFAGFRTHFVTGTTTIKYTTTGTTPNRKFVVSYDSLHVYCSNIDYMDSSWFNTGWYITGQVILYETTNIIETNIVNTPPCFYANGPPSTYIKGIQNSTATLGTENYNFVYYVSNEARQYVPYNAPLPALSVCMVSVDSATGKNIIIWNQPTGIPLDSFIIYKETSLANVYAPIGVQMNNVFSTFIDTGSYPAVVSNTYRLGFRDSCGIISDTSAPHTTIHLAVSQGIGNSWNLSWNTYVGFSFPSYNIYRGTSPSTMTLLSTQNSNVFAYSDLTPPSTVYYAIEVVNPTGCNPSARMANNYNSSMSNIVNPANTGLIDVNASMSISIFPNPGNTTITILNSTYSTQSTNLLITDVLGNKIHQQTLTDMDTKIDVSKWSEGVYFFQVKGQMTDVRGKFVKLN